MKSLYVFCFLISSIISSPVPPKPEEQYRLPIGVVEVQNYTIFLNLEDNVFVTNRFSGNTSIQLKILKPTSEIKLHINNINITSAILRENVTEINLTRSFNNVTDILTVTTETQLSHGSVYQLDFKYEAELRTNEMYGFYKSSYKATDNSVAYLGTTQFEPTHARKAFPCFDEPSYKAPFIITIQHPSQFNATGNTPINSTEYVSDSNNKINITTFDITPPMPTYLIAFAISDFTCTQGADVGDNVKSRVCSRKGTESTREVAVDAAPKLTKILEDYTNITYKSSGIGKMDQFGIPDFSAGAMENWGLITYRETGILWNKDESSNLYQQRLKAVVAHELAHMWFGNLVTTHWWSDTFLNEGFARYFQYFATAELEPTWELDKQFVIEQVHSMLAGDASLTSPALSAAASTPAEISLRFGSVSYNKGASILRMLKHFLGESKFRAGITSYLTENHFKSSTPAILWSHFNKQEALDLPASVNDIMKNWVEFGGFPVLNVALNNTRVTITQNRFLSSGSSNEQWYVPLTYTTSEDPKQFSNTTTKVWLRPNKQVILEPLDIEEWIILNNQQTGYYRVNYDSNLLKRIKAALNQKDFDQIHVLNRAQIVDDYYNFARVGLYKYSDLLELYTFLKNDTSYHSWYPAFTAFSNILQRIGDKKLYHTFSLYILDLMKKLLDTVPFNEKKDDYHIYTLNRAAAQNWACKLNQQDCIGNSTKAFDQYKSTLTKPDKNLKNVIYCNALRNSHNSEADWNFLWQEYGKADLATEKVTLLSALGCAKDKTVIEGYLKKSINASSGIRQQDALSAFSAVYNGNPEGVDIAFDFLLNNYNNIATYYGSMNSLNNLFSGLASRFNTQQQIDKLDTFLNKVQDLDESVKISARTSLANAKRNLEVTANLEKELSSYFKIDAGTDSANSPNVGTVTVLALILVIFQRVI